MRQYQIVFENEMDFQNKIINLKQTLEKNNQNESVFYITWTERALSDLDVVLREIETHFSESDYYGNEASGSISMGEFTLGINVSCYVFDDKESKAELLWVEEGTKLSSLEDLWKYCNTIKNLRGIELIPSMSYVETLKMDGNIPDIPEDVHIFGGASVNYDNATYDADILAKGHPRTKNGMAVLLYIGKTISFISEDILGWKGLGRLMEVTESTGKCIKQIDNAPAYSIYEKYLNLTMEDKDTLVFPLIVEEDGREYIRTPQTILDDKSMLMFANIPNGTMVHISYGDKNTILRSINEKANGINDFNPDAIKVYSCAARRLFWGDEDVSKETAPLQQITDTSGFYTGGEILRYGKKLRVLNQTLSIMCMREGKKKKSKNKEISFSQEEDKSLISRLTYFSEKIVEEEKEQRMLAEGFDKVLSSDYQVIYYISLIENKTTVLHGDENAKKFLHIFKSDSPEMIFENFNKYYVDAAVVEEDREKVKSVMNLDNILKTLKHNNTVSVNFRVRRDMVNVVYNEMRFFKVSEINGQLSEMLLTFKLSDKELRDVLEVQNKLKEDAQVIGGLASGYIALFFVNIDENSFKTYSLDYEKYPEAGSIINKGGNVFEMLREFGHSDIIHPDDRHLFDDINAETVRERLAHNKQYSVRFRRLRGDDFIWYEMDVVKSEDVDDVANGIDIGFADRDKEIRLEQEQAAALDYLKWQMRIGAFGDMINAAFWNLEIDDNDLIYGLSWSKEMRFMLGFENEEDFPNLIESWSDRLHPEDYNRAFYNFFEAIKSRDDKNVVYDEEFRIKRKTGEYCWYHALGRIEFNEDGTRKFFGIIIDISETKQLEEQHVLLLEARKAAEASSKSKSTFLFNMSHDIRTPMNAIKGFTAMAKKYIGNDEKVSDYLEKIDISGQQLITLINQVLEMSRIESGKIEFDEKPVNIKEQFETMVMVTSSQAHSKGIDFHYSFENITHNNVMADESRVGQVTLNIVGNAIKYTPEGGRIDFSLREIEPRKQDCASFEFIVSDTGIGMSEEYMQVMFEPFTREKNTTVSQIQGTGLGMSIVKSIVDLYGGSIDVESKVGEGTKFTVILDFKINHEAKAIVDSNVNIHSISFEGRRVLLVEDNEMNREIARDILEEYGFIVEEANDGDIAVDMCKEVAQRGEYNYYDFILMDVQMPRMNGYEATRAIRKIPTVADVHIPIIAMTANAFDEDKQNAFDSGMDEHLSKPIDIQKLLETLAKFL